MQAPKRITYHRKSKRLEIEFDGDRCDLPAELLRVYSPSAEVRGHSEQERVLQTGKKHVGITAVEPIGNYAIRISFDDGHDSGIYTWNWLRRIAPESPPSGLKSGRFEGGEFVLTEQKPRAQSRAHVVPLARGDGVVFAVDARPAEGSRGHHRLRVRHGVSEVRAGRRHTLGIIFHDAR